MEVIFTPTAPCQRINLKAPTITELKIKRLELTNAISQENYAAAEQLTKDLTNKIYTLEDAKTVHSQQDIATIKQIKFDLEDLELALELIYHGHLADAKAIFRVVNYPQQYADRYADTFKSVFKGIDQTFNSMKARADGGSRGAQCLVGYMYLRGHGTEQDYPSAKFYLQKSVNQRFSFAEQFLAKT